VSTADRRPDLARNSRSRRSSRLSRLQRAAWTWRITAPPSSFDEVALGSGQHTPPISPQRFNCKLIDQQANQRLERNAASRHMSLAHWKRIVERPEVGMRQGDRSSAGMPMERDDFPSSQDVVRIGTRVHAPAVWAFDNVEGMEHLQRTIVLTGEGRGSIVWKTHAADVPRSFRCLLNWRAAHAGNHEIQGVEKGLYRLVRASSGQRRRATRDSARRDSPDRR
jgi:hypothetical protein